MSRTKNVSYSSSEEEQEPYNVDSDSDNGEEEEEDVGDRSPLLTRAQARAQAMGKKAMEPGGSGTRRKVVAHKPRRQHTPNFESDSEAPPQSPPSPPPPTHHSTPKPTPRKRTRKHVQQASPPKQSTTIDLSTDSYNPNLMLPRLESVFRNLNAKTCQTGSFVQLSDFHRFGVPALIRYQRWERFMTLRTPSYELAIKCFYTNLHEVSEDDSDENERVYRSHFVSNIGFSATLIARLLNCPNEGAIVFNKNLNDFEEYPRGEDARTAAMLLFGNPDFNTRTSSIYSKHLTEPARVICNLLGWTVLPKGGNRALYNDFHILLTYCVMRKIRVNLPDLIINTMFRVYPKRMSPCYGRLITLIMEENGIDFSKLSLKKMKEDSDFTSRNLSLMHIYPPGDSRRPQGTSDEGPSQHAPPPPMAPQAPVHAPSPSVAPQDPPLTRRSSIPPVSHVYTRGAHSPPVTQLEFRRYKREQRSTLSRIFGLLKHIATCSNIPPSEHDSFEPPLVTPPLTPPRAPASPGPSTQPSTQPSTHPSPGHEIYEQYQSWPPYDPPQTQMPPTQTQMPPPQGYDPSAWANWPFG